MKTRLWQSDIFLHSGHEHILVTQQRKPQIFWNDDMTDKDALT